ncbi:MAG: acylphosphatase [Euryarchaeota archaeon]|nr:acylphosphatase [Euryarchaeota archaeon]
MQTMVKRYNILLRGKVQHIGYRGIIEGTARKLDMKGYVFNWKVSIHREPFHLRNEGSIHREHF